MAEEQEYPALIRGNWGDPPVSPACSRMEQTPEPRRQRGFKITSVERGRTEDGAAVPGKALGKHSDQPTGLIMTQRTFDGQRKVTVRDIWNESAHYDATGLTSPRPIRISTRVWVYGAGVARSVSWSVSRSVSWSVSLISARACAQLGVSESWQHWRGSPQLPMLISTNSDTTFGRCHGSQ